MVRLYGKEYTKAELLARVGDVAQVGGITAVELADGPERGGRALLFRTGTGLGFTVLADRGLDIYTADFAGASLAWRSPTGAVARLYHENEGTGWQRGFYGGLLLTCGLTNVGAANVDQNQSLGLHGLASYLPASRLAVETEWQGDEYVLRARGTMRQARAVGENLVWTRTITTHLGSNRIVIGDRMENQGYTPSPFMLLYHVNPGFPVLDEGARLLLPDTVVTPKDEVAKKGLSSYASFPTPQQGWQGQVFHHDLRPAADGRVAVALVNPSFGGGQGLGVCLRWNKNQLPNIWQWKMTSYGAYLVGLEPANCSLNGRAWHRAQGTLPMLGPGEARSFDLELEVLASPEAIAAAEREIQGA